MRTVPPPTNYERIRSTARRPAFDPSSANTPRQVRKFIPPEAHRAGDPSGAAAGVPPPPLYLARPEEARLVVVPARRTPLLLIGLAGIVAAIALGVLLVLSRRSSDTAIVRAPAPTASSSSSPVANVLPSAMSTESPTNGSVTTLGADPGAAPRAITRPPTSGVARVGEPPVVRPSPTPLAAVDPPSAAAPALAAPPVTAPHPAPRASNVPPGMEFLKHDL